MTAVRESFPDGLGVRFADCRKVLGHRALWAPAHRVHLSSGSRAKLFSELHDAWKFCFICGGKPGIEWDSFLEVHHITSGPFRSDERTALVMLCRRHHREIATIGLARVLGSKWKQDRAGLDWARLTIIRGSWLPAPEPPTAGQEFWPVGFGEKVRAG